MGRNNKARRAAKARARARGRAQHRSGSTGAAWPPTGAWGPAGSGLPRADLPPIELHLLARQLWLLAALPGDDGWTSGDRRYASVELDRLPVTVVDQAAQTVLVEGVAMLWAEGWQPAELRRQAQLRTSAAAGRLLDAVIAADHAARGHQRIDPRWAAQIDPDAVSETADADWVHQWAGREALSPLEKQRAVCELIGMFEALPPLDVLIPPPGAPPGAAGSSRSRPADVADPVLRRVRGLLAKAESSQFEAEATALTAKAQELITRHAIDKAILDDGGDDGPEPEMIRVPVDAPYADAKSLLLQIVAQHTRCRAVYTPALQHSSVVGMPSDLAGVEMLFTSLLVQGQHSLSEAGRTAPPGTRTRSQSYRSAFWLAFASRIGDRLRQINEHVFASAVADSDRFLPVLRSQEDAVAAFFEDRFDNVYSGAIRGGYDAAGAVRGRLAADQARLSVADLEQTGTDA